MQLIFLFFVFKCYKGVDQTWMSLNYTPFLLLVKSKMANGEGGVRKSHGTGMLCLSVFACVSFRLVIDSAFFFSRGGSPSGGA